MIAFWAAFLSALIAALGLGGGTVLLLYLTLLLETDQMQAQGINLLVFLPVAVLSLILHTKNGLISWKKIYFALLPGLLGTAAGYYLATFLGSRILSKCFGFFLLIIGLQELFGQPKNQ